MSRSARVFAVAIGRNEGERLVSCIASLKKEVEKVVYVDSGSTDGSVDAARELGAQVVELDLSRPFTAARARNAGFNVLDPEQVGALVQFVDGDCEVQPGWINSATAFLDQHPEVAAVCGRRRERNPERSIFNRLCDWEWDTPVGRAKAFGGDVLIRAEAFSMVGGYDPSMIAGEEPELCVRLRANGWQIWRIDAEMTLHDASMTRISQWWRRTRRAGHSFAEGAYKHGRLPERHNVRELQSCLFWGALVPATAIVGIAATPWSLLALTVLPANVVRLAFRWGGDRDSFAKATFLVLGKFPEALGALEFVFRNLLKRPRTLIEYK